MAIEKTSGQLTTRNSLKNSYGFLMRVKAMESPPDKAYNCISVPISLLLDAPAMQFSRPQIFPSTPLIGRVTCLRRTLGPRQWGRCVSPAGSLKSSRLGREIDDHDAVQRFNGAPTVKFQQDVGTKTTIHLVNSQLVTTEAGFLKDSLYNEGILIVWDPSVYHSDIPKWYRNPDYSFFNNFKSYRKLHPDQPFYILKSQMPWELWDIIQEISSEQIQPNPLSSGMLGIVIMMLLCDQVVIYKFLSSKHKTDKNMVKRLNLGTDKDIYLLGKATLHGFRTIRCGA
ncbi:hypothetical protein E5288_WYG021889 [Bos mutus]|uniref:Beta-galactoside alpha-2,6-sialyltransferase 1 n=1 Tax=Bos mutus TaxID=72004 RepID=A0A6B0SGE6_9CETA|nr:hypothetical protein [Bos mutus]